jgi:hypothetical protein
MKKLIHRIRDWLIKKLGGYTDAEYWKALHPPIQDEMVPIKRKNIERITATMEISRAEIGFRGFPSEQFIRKKLQFELAKSIGDCMQVRRYDDKFQLDNVVFETVIYVVREDRHGLQKSP